MYNKISHILTKKFVKLGIIKDDDFAIYKYGFELLIALLLTTVTMLTISSVIGQFIETILYLIGFFSVRVLCGGYHAKHHYSCFLTTMSSYFLFLFLNYYLCSKPYLNIFAFLMTLTSVVLIIAFSPVENPNNPMTDYRRNKNRFLSLILSMVIMFVHFITLLFKDILIHSSPFFIGIFLASLAILVAKVENVIKKRKEEQQ